jgi:hypothetical protein
MNLDRDLLRRTFDAVVEQIDQSRPHRQLTNGYYKKIGDSVFEACCRALEQSIAHVEGREHPQRMHVVSAPPGTGKTSFSQAFMVALSRVAEQGKDCPYGCVLVVETIEQADKMWRELEALLPGSVAVWTSDHNKASNKEPQKLQERSCSFYKDDLCRYPIAIVTHQFYKGSTSKKASKVVREDGRRGHRMLTLVDEQLEPVATYDATSSKPSRFGRPPKAPRAQRSLAGHRDAG